MKKAKHNRTILIKVSLMVFCLSSAITSNAQIRSLTNPAKWELVWSDEFNGKGLPDSTIWTFEKGYLRNKEAQYYTAERLENARIEDGMLVIEARRDDFEGHDITSASIHTFGKKSILYQRVEVCAKLPTGRGTWPAIWLIGDSKSKGIKWPDNGEIDIMENVGFDPSKIHTNIHTKAYNDVLKSYRSVLADKPCEKFHVYAMEWYEDRLDFFIDDTKYFTFYNEYKTTAEWPFDEGHYLIINLAIGGAWGGQQGINYELFPHKYYIDYVRVFKQKKVYSNK